MTVFYTLATLSGLCFWGGVAILKGGNHHG